MNLHAYVRVKDVIVRAARVNFPSKHAAAGKAGGQTESVRSAVRDQPGRIRRKKVQAVRRQLKLGRYAIDSRLTAILDNLLDDLLT